MQSRALDHELDMDNAGIIYKYKSQSIRCVFESSKLQNSLNFNISEGNYSIDPMTLMILTVACPKLPGPNRLSRVNSVCMFSVFSFNIATFRLQLNDEPSVVRKLLSFPFCDVLI